MTDWSTSRRLRARDRITDWWARGYARSPSPPVADRFVREAVTALSVTKVGDEDRLLDEIYTASSGSACDSGTISGSRSGQAWLRPMLELLASSGAAAAG